MGGDGAAGQGGVGAQRHCAGIGLRTAAGDRACGDCRAAADFKRRQTADRVVDAVAQHRVAGDGQGLAATGHGALRGDGAAGQGGAVAQAQRAAVGLSAAGAHRIDVEHGCAADAQAAQIRQGISRSIAKHCIGCNRQRVAIAIYRALRRDGAAGQSGVCAQRDCIGIGLCDHGAHAAAIDRGRAHRIGCQIGQSVAFCAHQTGTAHRASQGGVTAVVKGQSAVADAIGLYGACHGDVRASQGGVCTQRHRSGVGLAGGGGDGPGIEVNGAGGHRQTAQGRCATHCTTQNHIAGCATGIDHQRARCARCAVNSRNQGDDRRRAAGHQRGVCAQRHRAGIGLASRGGDRAAVQVYVACGHR